MPNAYQRRATERKAHQQAAYVKRKSANDEYIERVLSEYCTAVMEARGIKARPVYRNGWVHVGSVRFRVRALAAYNKRLLGEAHMTTLDNPLDPGLD